MENTRFAHVECLNDVLFELENIIDDVDFETDESEKRDAVIRLYEMAQKFDITSDTFKEIETIVENNL